jgi:hypothetical protein
MSGAYKAWYPTRFCRDRFPAPLDRGTRDHGVSRRIHLKWDALGAQADDLLGLDLESREFHQLGFVEE